MKRQTTTTRLHAVAGLVAAAVCCAALPARATTTFTTDRATHQVFCDLPALKGEFHRGTERYGASGSCVELEAMQSKAPRRTQSEFDQYNQSREVWRANWTAEGSYDATTKVTTETITLPAPNVNEFAPANRPYGRFVSKMVCATDPWLETRASCTGIVVTATGNLGRMEKSLRQMKRPFTSTEKEPLRDALIEQQARALGRLDPNLATATAQTGRAADVFNRGRSFTSRTVSTAPTRPGPTTTLAARPAATAAPISQVPASAPARYGTRSPVLDWGKAAPSALGSR